MRYISLILAAAFLLTGCEKFLKYPLSGHPAQGQTMLIFGQSNALHFGWWGLHAIQLKYPGIKIVNCAEPATTVEEWSVGGTNWRACINKLHGAQPAIAFWMQGESNAFVGDQSQFAERTIAIFRGLQALSPHVRIVFSQLGPNNYGTPYDDWQKIQDIQATIFLPGVTMVTAKDLDTEPGDIHLTPTAMAILGERVAEEF